MCAAGRAVERLRGLSAREPVTAHTDLSLVDQVRERCPAFPSPFAAFAGNPGSRIGAVQLAFVLAELIEVSLQSRAVPCSASSEARASASASVCVAWQEDAHTDELAQSGVVRLLLVPLLAADRTACLLAQPSTTALALFGLLAPPQWRRGMLGRAPLQ